MVSAVWRADVVDCDKRVRPYPGDLQGYTSAFGLFSSNVRKKANERDSLSTLLSLVNVCVQVNIRDISIQHRSSGLNHSVCELGRDSCGIAKIAVFVEN
jgi:hypothetical protein